MLDNFMSKSLNHVYMSVADKLIRNPDTVKTTRQGHTIRELVRPTLTVLDPRQCFATCRDLSLPYLNGELDFYLSGSPFLKDIQKFSKFWDKVTDDGRTVNSNYGKLLLHDRNDHNYTQWEWARGCLKRSSDTKKAVMVIYDKEKSRVSNDNPCTMYLQFITDGKGRLNLFGNMRSNDVWFGLPYDVPFFCMLLIRMAFETGLELGSYHHSATSLHVYDRNVEGITHMLENWSPNREPMDLAQEKLYRDILGRRLNEWKISLHT